MDILKIAIENLSQVTTDIFYWKENQVFIKLSFIWLKWNVENLTMTTQQQVTNR